MTSQVEAVREYLAWSEEQILSGNPAPTIDQYAEHLRVADIEDRLDQIMVLATEGARDHKGNMMKGDELLSLIAGLARVA